MDGGGAGLSVLPGSNTNVLPGVVVKVCMTGVIFLLVLSSADVTSDFIHLDCFSQKKNPIICIHTVSDMMQPLTSISPHPNIVGCGQARWR